MNKLLIVEPVLLINLAPIVGVTLPDSKLPKARSDPEPKLYVFPALSLPVPAAYVEFPPAS